MNEDAMSTVDPISPNNGSANKKWKFGWYRQATFSRTKSFRGSTERERARMNRGRVDAITVTLEAVSGPQSILEAWEEDPQF